MSKRPALTALLLATVLLASPALSQVSNRLAVLPPSPTPDEAVTLRLGGVWPDGCAPGTVVKPDVTVKGTGIAVVLDYSKYTGACTTVLTPYSVDLPLGRLAEGTYVAAVTYRAPQADPRVLVTATFTVAARRVATLYVPGVLTSSRPDPRRLGCEGTLTLASELSGYNAGTADGFLAVSGTYDEGGFRISASLPVLLAPGAAILVDTTPVKSRLQFLELRATDGMVVRPSLERRVACDHDAAPSQGRLELPVFDALFPGGTHAVCGDVRVLDSPNDACPTFAFAPVFRRRVNLTLLNAGSAPATFQVVARQLPNPDVKGSTVFRSAYEVGPGAVRQVDDLPLDLSSVCGAERSNLWFDVTSAQPFLFYVSTAFDDATPGALPYEVYAGRSAR